MPCEVDSEALGRFVDRELDAEEMSAVEGHLAVCAACAAEVENLRDLARELAPQREVPVPESLWSAINARLSNTGADSDQSIRQMTIARIIRTPWAIAALVALAIGLGVVGISMTGSRAQASEIDFSALLESIELDPEQAFQSFVAAYKGRAGSAKEAKRFARNLNFEVPENLPSGFKLNRIYLLEFGDSPGVAAAYQRGDEFLAAIFHRPVKAENFGTYKDYDCVVGKHRGHKVQVGAWKMVHVTDPTTCHCVLSRLDEHTELPAILSVVAPILKPGNPSSDYHD